MTDPCDTDATGVCSECRKQNCPQCQHKVGEVCEGCPTHSNMCYSVCDRMAAETSAFVDEINYSKFSETYEAIRCQRRRDNKKGMPYFPGMCRQHSNLFNMTESWAALRDDSVKYDRQDIMLWMINPGNCSFDKFPTFLELVNEQPGYEKATIVDLARDIMFTPMGITSISSIYFTWLLYRYNNALFTEFILRQSGEMSLPNVSIEAMLEARKQAEQYFQSADYSFLVDFIAVLLPWLNHEDPQLRMINWNLLNMKLFEGFYQGTSEEYLSWILPFSNDWIQKWNEAASKNAELGNMLRTDPTTAKLWEQLLNEINVVANVVNTRTTVEQCRLRQPAPPRQPELCEEHGERMRALVAAASEARAKESRTYSKKKKTTTKKKSKTNRKR
jgi:hypothetical protein